MNPEEGVRPGSRSSARATRDAAPHWCRGWPAAAAPGLTRDETGSGSWLCRHGCIRAAGWPAILVAATTRRDAARLGTARPRPRTRPRAQAGRPACRPARSAFFRRRIGIANPHQAVLALAHRDAGFAPGAALLPAQPSLVQGAPDRERADLGQPVRSLAQSLPQQAQRPRGRAVRLALGRARPFGQNTLLRVSAIAGPRATPMPRPHSGEPLTVEATDPGGDGLSVLSSDLVRRRRVASPIGNGQQHSGTLDLRGGSAGRAAQAGQGDPLVKGEWTQRVFPVARHGTPRGTRITAPLYHFPRQTTH